ncbi:hypothetical protein HMN09_00681100 [Mycena chlorophos]|uniref:Uncharacterized protein n=1 Tax=Mycena chlorophos TaxID=658473 RepID=A0A8H6SZS4_MYCCL|nr:hypothetical protein HMN09_00681100 [Mycena chlorophos]
MPAKPTRKPVPLIFVSVDTIPAPDTGTEAIRDGSGLRRTCSTPTFNQSTKLRCLTTTGPTPPRPALKRGQGIGSLRVHTDEKSSLSVASSSTLSRKSSLSSLGSRFRLKLRPSKPNLLMSDGSSESSRSSSPAGKPLPPLPALCPTIPTPVYEEDLDPFDEQPPAASPPFKVRRKPVPLYIPPSDAVPIMDFSTSQSSSDESSDEESPNPVERLGPNVFLTPDGESAWSLATAFTHIVRLSAGDGIERARVGFERENNIPTLHLPILPPGANTFDTSSILSAEADIMGSDLALINQSHNDIDFSSKRSRRKFSIRRKPAPKIVPPEEPEIGDELYASFPPSPQYSQADLVTTQRFLAAYGQPMSIPALASLLCEDRLQESDTQPLGIRATDITTALAYLRPHPFASAETRRRVLLVTPHNQPQLIREAVALGACYLAVAEGFSVKTMLQGAMHASKSAGRAFNLHAGTCTAPAAEIQLEQLWREVEADAASWKSAKF